MDPEALYHDGNRQLQDAFGSRGLADRLVDRLTRPVFTDDNRAFIEGAAYFFLATADAEGRPDCSFKGGLPGFVRVTGDDELMFPDYDGNGMFKSLGNIKVNPNVGLLFIAMHGGPRRMRIAGTATVHDDHPLLKSTVGAQLIVTVKARAIFPNCPRYIPELTMMGPSMYTPVPGHAPPEPGWKQSDMFSDVVPRRRSTFVGEA